MTDLPDLELRKEWTRFRALLYDSHDLALCTDERDGHRWLTDRYVLLDVTGSIAIEGVADGCYKLVQSRGFELRTHEFENEEVALANYLDGGIVDFLERVETGAKWVDAYPSEWSVAEHPGKAMLLTCNYHPVLMGESTWTALHRHYTEPRVEFDVASGRNLFRALSPDQVQQMAPPGAGYFVVAYVAGIRIPEGQEEVARAIALTSSQLATRLEA